MILKLLLLLAAGAVTVSSDGFGSIKKVFETLQSRQSTHCDVARYESATGLQALCDTTPDEGLVPDGTTCVFSTGYFPASTLLCDQGFWYQETKHPHYGPRVKRFFNNFRSLFDKFNELSDDDVDLPPSLQDQTTTTENPSALENDNEGWTNCPQEPTIVEPESGSHFALIEYDIPEYLEGWVVAPIQEANSWLPDDHRVNVYDLEGQTLYLSYKAENADSGWLSYCTLSFEFEAKPCDFEELKETSTSKDLKLECDSGSMGVQGETCHMFCDLGKSLDKENYASCGEDEGGNPVWKWMAEGNDTEDEAPSCMADVCTVSDLQLKDSEMDELECMDYEADSYGAASAIVEAGTECRRKCSDQAGGVCSGGGEEEETFAVYNEYYCGYDGTWQLPEEDYCSAINIWKNCVGEDAVPEVDFGQLCCSGAWCDLQCSEGFSPTDTPFAECNNIDGDYKWYRYEFDENGDELMLPFESFPETECKATCGSLPLQVLKNKVETDDQFDCWETEVDGTCALKCPEYHELKGTDVVTCLQNAATSVPEWNIPAVDGVTIPYCEVKKCEDLRAPEHGSVTCTDEGEGIKACEIECNDGYTHHLKYNTYFKCDSNGDGLWPPKTDIPVCYESSSPAVMLVLEAHVEASCMTGDTSFLDVDPLKDAAHAECPPGCTCDIADLETEPDSSNTVCHLKLQVTFASNEGVGFNDWIAKVASMFTLLVQQGNEISVAWNPSVTYFEQGICPAGYSFHQSAPEETPSCVKCMKGFTYDKENSTCRKCESGNSFLGECVEKEDDYKVAYCTSPDPWFKFRFSNCSSPDMAAETICKVHCSDPYKQLSSESNKAVFAHCTYEGKWEYSEDATCEGIPCDPGFYSDTGEKPCEHCPIGTYTETAAIGNTQCLPCPEGKTTGYDSSTSDADCQPDDAVVCSPGDIYSGMACEPCPIATYCPDGSAMHNCPDLKVTTQNRSTSEADCVAVSWKVEGEDADERSMTIKGLHGLRNFEHFEFLLRKLHEDVVLKIVNGPYVFQVNGDGSYKFMDADRILHQGDGMFSEENVIGDNWLYFSNTLIGDGFLLQIGKSFQKVDAPEETRSALDENHQEMSFTATLKAGSSIPVITDVESPHFAYMALYIQDEQDYNRDIMHHEEEGTQNFERPPEPGNDPNPAEAARRRKRETGADPPPASEYGADYEWREKRDCYKNLLNINAEDDWPQPKPVSCMASTCPQENENPDDWTCRPCRFGEYYSSDNSSCQSCPNLAVTRRIGATDPNECAYDAWQVLDYDRTQGNHTGPSASIRNLNFNAFGAFSFYIHQPVTSVKFTIEFAQYKLVINDDNSFEMTLGENVLIDGSGADLFENPSGSGWVRCELTQDVENMQFIFTYNTGEIIGPSLFDDLQIPPEDIEIPIGKLHLTIDVQRTDPESTSIEESSVSIAYMQLYSDESLTDFCTANEFFLEPTDYFDGCVGCFSTPIPYSCPETAEYFSCPDPAEYFGDYQLTFACSLGWGLYSGCAVSCAAGYLHGATGIMCYGSWLFDWNLGVPSCESEEAETPSCPEPKLSDNMLKIDVDAVTFTVACEDGYEFFGGYDEATQYTCDQTPPFKWNPPLEDLPGCYEPKSVRTGFPFELHFYNPEQLTAAEVHDKVQPIFTSKAVKKNSPERWDATIEIFSIDCGSPDHGEVSGDEAGANTTYTAEGERDKELEAILQEQCPEDTLLPECISNKWVKMQNFIISRMTESMEGMADLLPKFATAADPESVKMELHELMQGIYNLFEDQSVVELFSWIDHEIENYEHLEFRGTYEYLKEVIQEALAMLEGTFEQHVMLVEDTISRFGLGHSGRVCTIQAKIMASIPPEDMQLIQKAADMLEQFKETLINQGKVLHNGDYFGTTEVQCEAGKDLAAKGLCEMKTCNDGQVLNDAFDCERCDQFTSVITDAGECQECPTNTRAKPKSSGTKICAEQCPAGSFSADGYKNADTGKCTKCDKGNYQDGPGQKSCKECTGLSTTLEPGSTKCTTDYDLELKNWKFGDRPVTVHNMFDNRAQKLSLSCAYRRRGNSFSVRFDLADTTVMIDISNIAVILPSEENPANFHVNGDDVDFEKFTSIMVTIGNGQSKVYIDGVLLDFVPYAGNFEIPKGTDLNVSGNAYVSNFYLSADVETNPEQYISKKGVSTSKNLFGKEGVEAGEFDDSVAKLMTSTYTGKKTDHCENNPCGQGSCQNDIGKAKCLCPPGLSGKNCETSFEEKVAKWSDWTVGACSKTCGGGTQVKTRHCTGEGCQGESNETVSCNTEECKECPPLEYDDEVIPTVTETPTKKTIQLDCPDGKVFPRIGNTKANTKYQCGLDTGYKWAPTAETSKCTKSKPPSALKKAVNFALKDGVIDSVSCTEPGLSNFKAGVISGLAYMACRQTDTKLACDIVVIVQKCGSTTRRKRNTGQDVVLEFTLPLDEEATSNLQSFYDTNTVNPDLLEVVQAIANIENVDTEVKNLNVSINGVTYTVDPASVTATSSSSCGSGYYSDSSACVPCGIGTYHDSTSDFCVQCPKGEYQPEVAKASCIECDVGYTTTFVGSTSSSHCIVDSTYVGPSDDSKKEDNGKVVGIAVGVSVAALVLIAAAVAIGFKVYMTSKASGSAGLPTTNLVHPNAPSKNKLYSEIDNPHFVPPPKPYEAAVDPARAGSITPPGTVLDPTPGTV